MDAPTNRKSSLTPIVTILAEYFGLSRTISLIFVALLVAVIGCTTYWFVHFTPPRTITIISGPAGSSFERFAGKYRDILARSGVTLKILNSAGSSENLAKLQDRANRIDIAFIQGGTAAADATNTAALVSLGSIAYEPLLLFSSQPIRFLS